MHEQRSYPIYLLCQIISLNRSSYYKWLKREKSSRQLENEKLVIELANIYYQYKGINGYRRLTMQINKHQEKRYNHKRIYRLMKILSLQAVIRKKKYKYKPSAPQITAQNILNRCFNARKSNEKWLTDITELSYGNGRKAYLSIIYALGEKRIVSYVLGHNNINYIAFKTFDKAIKKNPTAKPIFHSDRGFQYTSKYFRKNCKKPK